jgi:hypothetical protein
MFLGGRLAPLIVAGHLPARNYVQAHLLPFQSTSVILNLTSPCTVDHYWVLSATLSSGKHFGLGSMVSTITPIKPIALLDQDVNHVLAFHRMDIS